MAFQGSTTSATAPAENAGGKFQFGDLLRVASERATFILTVATAVVVLTIIALLLWPTTYSASAVVLLDPRINNVAQNSAVLSAMPSDPASVQNQVQILQSRDIAAQVIANLKLYDDPEFASPNTFTGEMPSADRVIDTFLKHLSVEANGLSTSLSITFKSRSGEKSARIANAIADAYLQDQVNVENAAARNTTEWLITRIHTLAHQVQQAESAVQQYKATNNLSDTGNGTSLVDQQLIGVNSALVAAKSDLAEKQANASHINAMLKSGEVGDVSQVVGSPLIVSLRTQEADVLQKEAQLSTRYGPRNPKMVDIESQKENLQAKVAQEAARIGGSVANDVSVSRAQVGSLQYSLNQLEKKATAEGLARVQLKALEANATSTRTMYEAFVTRLREAQGGIEIPDARIISHAAVPASPASPKRTMIAAASVPVGLMIGLLLALLAERTSPATQYRPVPVRASFHTAEPAPDPLRGARILGDIPDYAALRAADLIIDRPAETYARAVDTLLAQIVPKTRGKAKIIALTAPDQSDGKTALATALARAATQRGYRTIVIDGDFQWPKAAIAMGLQPVPRGLQDVLSGLTPLSQSLVRDPRSSALLLSPAAAPTANTSFIAALPQLFDYLRRTFDLVIVDCPQPGAGNAARYFLPLSDAAMLLVRWQTTPRAAVSQTLDSLAAMHVPATGIVFAR